ncbi:hypothetical protein [Actinomadura sp. K4S16]|uniref:hypothetical protein n=1 Tax=Actinomadura sp. K4S16 TaxID=1316147 RepID=UPI001359EE68|nr:hypothetical protein [Actinomadura sp. K4S16]
MDASHLPTGTPVNTQGGIRAAFQRLDTPEEARSLGYTRCATVTLPSGEDMRVAPANLSRAPRQPEFTATRRDLRGDTHTITVERLPEEVAPLRVMPPFKPGRLVIVERRGGRFARIWATEDDLWSGTSMEVSAQAIADEIGARYIP